MNSFYSRLEDIIQKALHSVYPAEDFSFFLEIPRNKEFGDLALTAPLKLSSHLKQPPLRIARDLKEKIEELLLESNPGIGKVEIAPPGFINFFLRDEAVKELLHGLLKDKEKFFKQSILGKEKIILEFVSANPTGPLSIAHGRQAVVGDVLANALSFLGAKVTKEYYINDVGTQIDLYIETVKGRMKEQKGEDFHIPEKGYLGDDVKVIANDTLQALIITGPQANSEEFNEEEFIRKDSLGRVISQIKGDLASLGIAFDSWVSQKKDVIDAGEVEGVIKFLKDKGLIYEREGAVWFSSTKFGDDKDRVIKKADGELTYFASDIAYHKNKIERGFNRLINLWGPDHHGYIARVTAAIDALGFKKEFLRVIIIQLVNLRTKERMSKRRGTAICLSDLVSEVGKDAARFYYLTRKNSSHLEFDIDQAVAKNFDNPLYYIQYAHARICSIINKYKGDLDSGNIRLLKEKGEISLIKEILQFRNVIELVAQQCEPFFIVDYLKGLANSFHKFYENHRVLLEDDRSLTEARILLIKAVKVTLGLGLKLLGIEAPARM